MNDSRTGHSAYMDAMARADKGLDDDLTRLRALEDEGLITMAESAAGRIALMERHQAECRRLRMELLGE